MLKEKIGQMLIIGFNGAELNSDNPIVQSIQKQRIGGVILFDYNFRTKKLTHQLQYYADTPLFVGIDYEGGKVNRLKEEYGFPKTLSAQKIGELSQEEAEKYANTMAETLKDAGINLNFAPSLDVNLNPDNPIIGKLERSFSSDPKKVADYAAVFLKAHQDHGVISVYKHFPGHGSSTGDTHTGFVDVTGTWQECELEPYKKLLLNSSDFSMVMTAHVVHYGLDPEGYPASLSFAMTKNLLREKLNFNGVVVTDDLQMKAVTDRYGTNDAIRLAINAGADILVFGNQLVSVPQNPEEIIETIYKDVIDGKISEKRIDQAYQRIMQLKSRL